MTTATEIQTGGDPDLMTMARRVGIGGALAGLVGGAVMIGLMIIVMGAEGSGYATPLNLGIPAFAKTITPPLQMLPTMMAAMGIHLPPETMAQLKPALASGHLSPPMMNHLGEMLMGMHMPPEKVHQIGDLMAGHASNSTMADLLSEMPASARHEVMHAMPVTGGNVVLGAVTHFVLAVLLGVAFAMAIIGIGIERLSISVLRTPVGIIPTSVVGGAIVYVVNRWLILPAIDPMMRLVPEGWFFVAHLLFGLVVGIGITMIAAREHLLEGGSKSPHPVAS
ncbi:MAG: hypothetical protein JST08_20025 [Actinobacteria bacterium]|nr:hypothetical protein [Actinomycetota bacterium]